MDPDQSVITAYMELEELARHLNEMGVNMDPVTVVTKIVSSLPDAKYLAFKKAWDSVPDASQTMTMLLSRLQKEELDHKLKEGTEDVSSTRASAFAVFHKKKQGWGPSSVPEGSGKHVKCFRCGKPGHFARKCPASKTQRQKDDNPRALSMSTANAKGCDIPVDRNIALKEAPTEKVQGDPDIAVRKEEAMVPESKTEAAETTVQIKTACCNLSVKIPIQGSIVVTIYAGPRQSSEKEEGRTPPDFERSAKSQSGLAAAPRKPFEEGGPKRKWNPMNPLALCLMLLACCTSTGIGLSTQSSQPVLWRPSATPITTGRHVAILENPIVTVEAVHLDLVQIKGIGVPTGCVRPVLAPVAATVEAVLEQPFHREAEERCPLGHTGHRRVKSEEIRTVKAVYPESAQTGPNKKQERRKLEPEAHSEEPAPSDVTVEAVHSDFGWGNLNVGSSSRQVASRQQWEMRVS